ncbi:DUF805 domain-containing protein [Prochlorococcus marinus]|uniref:DUF805 domain-containing protein n=1 Tax=Prochlorococcus marinus TaxID=1219 RepID=UPI0022B5DE10|nr:DUF805 domain-containing protein [Prochlorococcus marinus]
MIEAYKRFWTLAFEFKGRTSRPDYWWAVLASFLVALILAILGSISEPFMALYLLYYFATFTPNISMSIRRLRDIGKSWQWIFINFIPMAGGILFLIILCRPSVPIV